jgi:uncharacterized protein
MKMSLWKSLSPNKSLYMLRPFSWMNPRLEVRDTGTYGRGVFANDTVASGDVLIVMGGNICNTEQENELGEMATNYNMDISEEWSFCPTQESDLELMPQHLVNHSCEPNAGFSEQCFMVAIRDIAPGEEVAYDYAFVMWSANESELHFEMSCGCGSPSCRKVVREDDWTLPDLQQRYGEWFQPFLRKKFKK